MFGLGKSISAVGLAATLWQTFKDGATWTEVDKIVSANWLDLAKKRYVLDPDLEYRWSAFDKVESRILEGAYGLAYALDPSAKVKYRIVRRDAVLIARRLHLTVEQELQRAIRCLHWVQKLQGLQPRPHPKLTQALKHQRRAVRLYRKALTETPGVRADGIQEE